MSDTTTSFDGSASRLALTAMRPANPTLCDPSEVIAPVVEPAGVEEERQLRAAAGERGRGLRGRDRVHVDPVGRAVVEDAQRRARRDWRTAAVSCQRRPTSWVTTEAMPPEKSRPITWSFGSAVALSGSGSAAGSSTRINVTVRCAPVALSV